VRPRQRALAQLEQRLAGTARDLSADAGDHSPARAGPGRLRPESDRLLQPRSAVLPDASDHGRRPLLLRRAVSATHAPPRRRDGELSLRLRPLRRLRLPAPAASGQASEGAESGRAPRRGGTDSRCRGGDRGGADLSRSPGGAARSDARGSEGDRRPDEAASRRALPRAPDHGAPLSRAAVFRTSMFLSGVRGSSRAASSAR
jgi:hypothetical protein